MHRSVNSWHLSHCLYQHIRIEIGHAMWCTCTIPVVSVLTPTQASCIWICCLEQAWTTTLSQNMSKNVSKNVHRSTIERHSPVRRLPVSTITPFNRSPVDRSQSCFATPDGCIRPPPWWNYSVEMRFFRAFGTVGLCQGLCSVKTSFAVLQESIPGTPKKVGMAHVRRKWNGQRTNGRTPFTVSAILFSRWNDVQRLNGERFWKR